LLISVGSGIGLLGKLEIIFYLKFLRADINHVYNFFLKALPILVADCILLNFTKHKDFYEGIKIHDYEKDDLNFNVRV